MAKEQSEVDLDALEEVARELTEVLRDMGGPNGKADNNTYLPQGALGWNFFEADELYAAHDEMKAFISTDILALITELVDDFRKKSRQVKEAYEEAELKNNMK
ncbi:hypothetical protein FCH28_18580 [Streptomyces piniterrae]|uniref:PE domain-containing protein n=1 Tax=Streptomyces piniterrae TaxID=2571125 RepID=A0A4U0ND33_9ACTN|nr:hypothetical protein [Streptomyces piniterrae]TJZ51870.1 hypothetical protein FCH28_18580 [Streptomyces piniterrae]